MLRRRLSLGFGVHLRVDRCLTGFLLASLDYDNVEMANMNRLFFRPEQCGMTKTEAASQTLSGINPDVDIESYSFNITSVDGYDKFHHSLIDASSGTSRVDLVLSCVDNYEARITINQVSWLPRIWQKVKILAYYLSSFLIIIAVRERAFYLAMMKEGFIQD